MSDKILIDENELVNFYENGTKTISDCARHFNTSNATIRKNLKLLGVYVEVLKPQKKHFHLDYENAKAYLDDGKTIKDIAKIVNAPQVQISKHLQSLGIEYNKKPNKIDKPSKEALYDLYWINSKTMYDIAKIYNTTNPTVRKWLKSYGIRLRSHREVHCEIVSGRVKETNLERYGMPSLFGDKEFSKKCMKNRLEKYGTLSPQINLKKQNNVKDFFESVSAHNFSSTYDVLNTRELDGYNVKLNIAFEFCGLYWHNDQFIQDKNYHHSKYVECINKNIRLLTIFEDEWKYRNSQVKGFIESIISPNITHIYARKCFVKLINNIEASDFINEYHIQPFSYFRILYAYGIYYNEELLGVMSFGRHHRQNGGNENSIVLSRLVFKRGYKLIGGASKLFQYALKNELNDYGTIISWSDNRWSLGNVYSKMGFSLDVEYGPDYSYVDYKKPDKRIPKQNMTKKKINCKESQTERERALELGYARIWDCGKKKWIYRK
jgi:transposase-like protein